MSYMSFLSALRARPLPDLGHPFAIVDVETTGLNSSSDRVVQIAVNLLDKRGALEHSWHTLVDPKRDPGPVHIHGITPERLVGAPTFNYIANQLAALLHNRVIVAHNAGFDWRFLNAESFRAASTIVSTHRLCTLALARRLDLDLPNLKLETLAMWAQVGPYRAHDASEDARVLHAVFLKLVRLAHISGIPLPLFANEPPESNPRPNTKAPVMNAQWRLPGKWSLDSPLQQGMKFVITGGTRAPREDLYDAGIRNGLVPMNTVSGRTRLLICRDGNVTTQKAVRARELDVPIIGEERFLELLQGVMPGIPVGQRQQSIVNLPKSGPMKGFRVLVIGGPHESAAEIRERVVEQGGRVAVNFTPTVSHLVLLEGSAEDPRTQRGEHLPRLDPASLAVIRPSSGQPREDESWTESPVGHLDLASSEPKVLRRGEPWDIPNEASKLEVFVSWTLSSPPYELDAMAFITDSEEKVLSDDHFVFYNSPESPNGEVRLSREADSESLLSIDLDELTTPGTRVIVAAALGGGANFGGIGPLELMVRTQDGSTLVRTVLDAATTETCMLLAEFYQRGDSWRIRAVGQGYEDSLAGFAIRHGVDVE